MAGVSCRWHSAHLPVASTRAGVGSFVSILGRRAFTRNAATMSAVATTTATKTLLNGMVDCHDDRDGRKQEPRAIGARRMSFGPSRGGRLTSSWMNGRLLLRQVASIGGRCGPPHPG